MKKSLSSLLGLACLFMTSCMHASTLAKADSLTILAPKLTFVAESSDFSEATADYQKIWQADGERILSTLEKVSNLSFHEDSIKAIVYEGVSHAGHLGEPIFLRASYPFEIKREALIHELGHKMQFDLQLTPEIDLHRALFLFLYDVWVDLYGIDFADKSVSAEKLRKGGYNYDAAWTWALSYTREQRAAILARLVHTTTNH